MSKHRKRNGKPQSAQGAQLTMADSDISLEEPAWFTHFSKELTKKMDQLPDIQRSVDELRKKSFPGLEKSVSDLNARLDDVNTSILNGKTEVKELNVRLATAEAQNLKLQKDVHDMKSKILYLESQSKRKNLIIDGLEDSENETWDDCEQLVLKFFEDELNLEDIQVDRVHRNGQFGAGKKPRTVVVNFCSYKDRQLVWQNRYEARDKSIRIYEDYPSEISANRRLLWPIYKAAKNSQDYKNVSLKLDKLWIDGKMYTTERLKNLPEGLQPHNRCHKQTDEVFVFYSKHSPLSNFHPLQIKIEGFVYSCNEQFFQRSKALYFGDHQTAEMIMNESDPVKMTTMRVKGYVKELWDQNAYKVLKHVNEVKFNQHPAARLVLQQTGNKTIGEASPSPIYGTGVHISSPTATDTSAWTGRNMMGDILSEIRDSCSSLET